MLAHRSEWKYLCQAGGRTQRKTARSPAVPFPRGIFFRVRGSGLIHHSYVHRTHVPVRNISSAKSSGSVALSECASANFMSQLTCGRITLQVSHDSQP